jgi:lipopolysaccharide biosynthesis regulator YciM
VTDTLLMLTLLAVSAACGWYLGRQNTIRSTGKRLSRLSTTYFRGLNYLLNEQPDKAIELFLQIAHADRDTIETQIALGHLFRTRGEVERAIRLHQGLVSRTDISDADKIAALLELGEDYMRAGLLDRAETLFTDLVRLDEQQETALRHLLAIYQFERDWPKSIEFARRVAQVSGESCSNLIAHFHCEMAEQARRNGDGGLARDRLMQAVEADPNSPRAGMLLAQIEFAAGNLAAAIRLYERVARHDTDYLPEVLAPLLACYQQHGDHARARAFLAEMLERHHGVAPVLAMARLIEHDDGRAAALDFLASNVRERPSISTQAALIALGQQDSDGPARALLDVLADSTDGLLKRAPGYRCNRCGFGARSHHWQCPSCRVWGSVMPVQGDAVK